MRFLILAALLSTALYSQNNAESNSKNPYDVGPSLIPATASAADAVARTVFIKQISLNNESAADETCVIVDKQATPRSILGSATKPLTVSAGAAVVAVWPFGRRATGGITWSCSSGTAITGHIVYEIQAGK